MRQQSKLLFFLTFYRLLATLSPLVQNQKALLAKLVLSHLEKLLQLCLRTGRSKTTDSLDWSKKYEVLSISRLMLRDQFGFRTEQVNRLSDEDLDRIAYWLENQFLDHGFHEMVKFIVSCELAEKGADHGSEKPMQQDGET